MYWFAKIVEYGAYLSVVGIALALGWGVLQGKRGRNAYQRRKGDVGKVPTYEHEDEEVKNVQQAQWASLKFMGLPSIHAGRTILGVPQFNPQQTGKWEEQRIVISTSRITAMLKQGAVPGDLVEFDGGYVLFGTNGKTFLLQNHLLTSSEEDRLQQERQEAVEKGDAVINNFQGLTWKIGTACGSHKPRSGEKGQSTIQVLSVHPDLGKDGIMSCLPPNLLDRKEHDYYDMRVRSGDQKVMLFFFAGGKWNCFMGRELNAQECNGLQGL